MDEASPDATHPAAVVAVRVLTFARDVAARVEELARRAEIEAPVHVVSGTLEDATANARAAKPERGVLAVVAGRNAAIAALGAGVDEAVEEHVLTPELFALAARLADERLRHRRERERFRRSLAHTAQLSALGTVVAGVAHEVNTPATALNLHLSNLLAGARDACAALDELERRSERRDAPPAQRDVRRALDAIRAALGDDAGELVLRDCVGSVRVITDVIRDLRVLSYESSAPPPEVVDLRQLIDQVLRLTGVEIGKNIHIERDFGDDLPSLWLPRSRLLQIVANLVSNAGHAMRARPRPIHRLRIMARSDETTLMLAFSDTGTGIAPDTLPRLFEPFFTTKGPEHGTGLGLHMSREIVRSLGGDLTIDSVYEQGTTAMIFLPLVLQTRTVPATRDGARQGARRSARARSARVLVVCEELERLRLLRDCVAASYEVALATSGVEALALLESGSRVDGVVCGRDATVGDDEALLRALVAGFPLLERRIVRLDEAIDPSGGLDERRLTEALLRAVPTS